MVLSSDVSAPVPSQDESDDWIEPVAEKVREIMGDMTIELRKDLIDDLRIMIDGKGFCGGRRQHNKSCCAGVLVGSNRIPAHPRSCDSGRDEADMFPWRATCVCLFSCTCRVSAAYWVARLNQGRKHRPPP